jgi:hypothetical protein
MTEERDPVLQNLFNEAPADLDGEQFVARVMARTQVLRYRFIVGAACFLLALAVSAWMLEVPLELAMLVTEVLTTPLLDLGDNWLAWAVSPLNNPGALLVLLFKMFLVFRRRIIGVNYAF